MYVGRLRRADLDDLTGEEEEALGEEVVVMVRV